MGTPKFYALQISGRCPNVFQKIWLFSHVVQHSANFAIIFYIATVDQAFIRALHAFTNIIVSQRGCIIIVFLYCENIFRRVYDFYTVNNRRDTKMAALLLTAILKSTMMTDHFNPTAILG